MKLILWEIWSYLEVPVIWWLYKRYGKKNVAGSMVAGAIIGCFLEFATEPLWTYHFKFTIYKDTPPGIILGWGVLFTLVTTASEAIYKRALHLSSVIPHDKRIFLFDVLCASIIALPMEAIGLHSGVWDYNYTILNWTWGTIPLINMPYEALVGYALLMLVAPTFVRYWRGYF